LADAGDASRWPEAFIEHGKPDALRAKYGISVAATVGKTLPYLKKAAAPATPAAS
jgi:1-deoxy-D-xylulose-5-phosphate synthase